MASIQKRPGPRYRVQVRLFGAYRSATQTEHALYAPHRLDAPASTYHTLAEFCTRYARLVMPLASYAASPRPSQRMIAQNG